MKLLINFGEVELALLSMIIIAVLIPAIVIFLFYTKTGKKILNYIRPVFKIIFKVIDFLTFIPRILSVSPTIIFYYYYFKSKKL